MVLEVPLIYQSNNLQRSVSITNFMKDRHLFDDDGSSFGIRNDVSGLSATQCNYKFDYKSNKIEVRPTNPVTPIKPGANVHMMYHAVAKTLVISIDNQPSGYSFSLAELMTTDIGRNMSLTLCFAVTLMPTQQVIITTQTATVETLDTTIFTTISSKSQLPIASPAGSSKSLNFPLSLSSKTDIILDVNEMNQTISAFDEPLSDTIRLQFSEKGSTVYYPTRVATEGERVRPPVAATRLTRPRASFTVMLSRNVLINDLLSLGLARVFTQYQSVGEDADIEISKFFKLKSGFGIERNSWGLYDLRKGNSLFLMITCHVFILLNYVFIFICEM
jgi:hypothetical protein